MDQEAQSFFQKGADFARIERHDKALEYFDLTISLKPNHFQAHFQKGLSLFILEDYEEAIRSFDQSISLNPRNAEAFYRKGVCLNQLGCYDESLESFRTALFLKPKYADVYCAKGEALFGQKDYKNAVEELDQAIELEPTHAAAYEKKGDALFQLEMYKEAIECFDKVTDLRVLEENSEEMTGLNKRDYLSNLEIQNYEEIFVDVNEEEKPSEKTLKKIKQFASNFLKKYKRSIGDYKEDQAWNEEKARLLLKKGLVWMKLGDVSQAQQLFMDAIVYKPDYAEVYLQNGNCALELEDYDTAIDNYNKALLFNSSLSEAKMKKKLCFNQDGEAKRKPVPLQVSKARKNWRKRGTK